MRIAKTELRKLAVVVMLLTMATACATVAPGQDPVLVRAQQTYQTSVDTFDLLFNLELENKDLIESKLPGTHMIVDKVKVQAKVALPALLSAIDTYKANKDQVGLTKWLAVVEDLLRSAQGVVSQVSAAGLVKGGK
jgi:hypothetical protein